MRYEKGFGHVGSRHYYFNPSNGKAQTGWLTLNGKKYYFNTSSAVMYMNTTAAISGKTYAVSENVECCKKVGGSRYTQDDWFQQDTGAERLNACRVSHQNMTIYIDPVGQQVRIVVGN